MDAALARRGLERVPTTPLQPRVRPWSMVLVAETTDQGRVWFKATSPEMSPEAAVLRALRSVAPDAVPVVWADDPERGWLLMPDQGPVLRDVQRDDDAVSLMSSVVRRYARLQRSSTRVVDQLRDAGVPDMSPRESARRWQRLGLKPDTTREVRRAAQRLDAVGLPLTIQHDDLHAGNVFADGTSAGAHDARIFDWGDASVGNPLCSLLVPLERIGEGLDDDAARAARERILRAYLSVWSDVVASTALSAAVDDALLIARVGRVFTWQRALTRASADERHAWGVHGRRLIAEINRSLGHAPEPSHD
ncbi:phosphotransferase family protein [Dermacoccus nishinomiyaensis]